MSQESRHVQQGRHIVDRLAPGWLVVQFLGTGMLVIALLAARERYLWVWLVYAASIGCWLLFIALHPWRPQQAATVLGFSAVLPALVTGVSDDSTAIVMLLVLLGRFTSLPSPSARVLAAVSGACLAGTWLSCLLAHQPLTELFGYPLLTLLTALLGLNRRQHQMRANQAEELLTQTLLAQQQQARAATLAERARIAREIHDVLAHSLGALSVQLKVAEALIEKGDTDGARDRVRRSNRLADDGLTEARNAVSALRGESASLPEALEALAEQHRANHRSEVELEVTGEARQMSATTTVALARMAREALTNAAKHAPGEKVSVHVDYTADELSLTVANSVPESANRGDHLPGYGLIGVRERLAFIGGALTMGRQDGDRWVVTAQVPE